MPSPDAAPWKKCLCQQGLRDRRDFDRRDGIDALVRGAEQDRPQTEEIARNLDTHDSPRAAGQDLVGTGPAPGENTGRLTGLSLMHHGVLGGKSAAAALDVRHDRTFGPGKADESGKLAGKSTFERHGRSPSFQKLHLIPILIVTIRDKSGPHFVPAQISRSRVIFCAMALPRTGKLVANRCVRVLEGENSGESPSKSLLDKRAAATQQRKMRTCRSGPA